jgi:hypothetical protein
MVASYWDKKLVRTTSAAWRAASDRPGQNWLAEQGRSGGAAVCGPRRESGTPPARLLPPLDRTPRIPSRGEVAQVISAQARSAAHARMRNGEERLVVVRHAPWKGDLCSPTVAIPATARYNTRRSRASWWARGMRGAKQGIGSQRAGGRGGWPGGETSSTSYPAFPLHPLHRNLPTTRKKHHLSPRLSLFHLLHQPQGQGAPQSPAKGLGATSPPPLLHSPSPEPLRVVAGPGMHTDP